MRRAAADEVPRNAGGRAHELGVSVVSASRSDRRPRGIVVAMGVEEREIVIRRSGASFAFSLPYGTAFEIDDSQDDRGRPLARIGVPGAAGETVAVAQIVERDGEIEFIVESTGVASSVGRQPPGYPWPQVQDEHERLRVRWEEAGGRPTDFLAWRQGASWDSQFAEWRARIREMQSSGR